MRKKKVILEFTKEELETLETALDASKDFLYAHSAEHQAADIENILEQIRDAQKVF